MSTLQDVNQVQDQSTCEEEQGISPEDDEAKAIEAGEFCRPGVNVNRCPIPVGKVVPANESESDALQKESGPMKKKARKI